jgi:hypothetical protein
LVKLTKALTLCSGQNKKEYEKQLYRYILIVRKIMWLKNYHKEKQQIESLFI